MKECGCPMDNPTQFNHVGCLQKFESNHFNLYKRRRDTNITINTKQVVCTDQTPTPTKLLRNCDEVGLFKDLLVNPFEDVFRKAVEAGSHREESFIRVADDTLHTPNVFPIGTEPEHCKDTNENGRVNKVSDVAESLVKNKKKYIPIRPKKKSEPRVEKSTQCENHFVVLDKNITFKLPIPKLPPSIKVVHNNAFSVLFNNTLKGKQSNKQSNFKSQFTGDVKFDLLESNRLAQKRTRDKRKMFYQEILQKNVELEAKVTSLLKENALLKRKLEQKNVFHTNQKKSSQHNNCSKGKEKPMTESAVEQVPNNKIIANPEILGPESSLPILETKDSTNAVLRKPFKKRDIHPKLYLSCKPLQDIV